MVLGVERGEVFPVLSPGQVCCVICLLCYTIWRVCFYSGIFSCDIENEKIS